MIAGLNASSAGRQCDGLASLCITVTLNLEFWLCSKVGASVQFLG